MTPIEVDLLNELEEIQCRQVVPVVGGDDVVSVADLPMGLGKGCNSEGSGLGDSRHASPEDSSSPPPDKLVDLCEAVTGLKTHVARQDRKIDELEDLVDSFRHQALGTKAGKKPAALSPAPAPAPALPRALAPANAPKGPKAKPVLVNKSSRLPRKPAYTPPAVVRPSDISAPAAWSSPTSASWAKTAAASGGENEFTVFSRRKIASPPPAPQWTERARHVIVRFEKCGSKARLPTGVNNEMVKNALNKALANGGSAARFGSCVAHRHPASALNEGLRSRMERAVMGLGIGGLSFHHDTPKIKVLVLELPFAPCGIGAAWKPEDWQGESAFDDLVRDLEVTNPGFNVVGRPHWIGSLASQMTHKHVKGSVVFVVERNSAVTAAIEKRRVVVFSRRRPLCVGPRSNPPLCGRGAFATSGPNLRHASPATSGASPFSTKVVSEETPKTGITDHTMQKLVEGPQTLAVEVVIAVRRHTGCAAVMEVETTGVGRIGIGGVCFPLRISKDAMAALLTELDDCDGISGDFNAPHLSWETQGYGSGSAVLDYMSGRDMIRQIHGGPTFRGISTNDLTWSTPGLAIRYACYYGAATEHLAQCFRLEVSPCDGHVHPPIPWKRVDWNVVAEVVDGLDTGLSKQSMASIVRGLRGPAVRGKTVGWWTVELGVIKRDEGLSGSYGRCQD
ncbi:hypothetical protein HOY82DRAFT_538195 [Tuber indicum]|nr:hypothetical protein HOY82DRAFT_538195 [Tuber indicum]